MILPLPAEIRVSFYRSPPENQSLEQHQADEELDIKVTDKEQYNYTRQPLDYRDVVLLVFLLSTSYEALFLMS